MLTEKVALHYDLEKEVVIMGTKLTDAKREAIKRYDAKNTKQIHMKLNLNTDAELLEWLAKQDSVQGYIKSLIRDDIARNPSHAQLEVGANSE